jgi:hypothetical protein
MVSNICSIEEFLSSIAGRDRSQGRLSVAALTASCCAAQLEAQCREVLLFRQEAPGPCPVEPLIAELQRARSQLCALLHQALEMETASMVALVLPDGSFEERLRRQLVTEKMLSDFVVAGTRAACLIVTTARIARQVHKLRTEVRGGAPTEHALLAAASTAVLDVIERALRMSRVQDAKVRTEALRAMSRLRPLCLVVSAGDADQLAHTLPVDDPSRWN